MTLCKRYLEILHDTRISETTYCWELVAGKNIMRHWKPCEELRSLELPLIVKNVCLEKVNLLYGHKFTKEGLKLTEKKVDAVKSCASPQSKTDGRRFLGMTGYLSKFIPHHASLTKSLRDFTLKYVKFHWGEKEETALAQLKSKSVMAFFNPMLAIMAQTEPSYKEKLSAGYTKNQTKDGNLFAHQQ